MLPSVTEHCLGGPRGPEYAPFCALTGKEYDLKKKMKRLLGAVLGSGAVFFLVLAVISAVALLGGNLMAVFGFQYRSVGQLILYFLLVELISIPLDPFCQGTPRALYKMERVNRRQANMLYIPLDALCTFFAFWLADRLMDGVSATGVSLWVIAFVLALLTLPVHRKEDNPPDG